MSFPKLRVLANFSGTMGKADYSFPTKSYDEDVFFISHNDYVSCKEPKPRHSAPGAVANVGVDLDQELSEMVGQNFVTSGYLYDEIGTARDPLMLVPLKQFDMHLTCCIRMDNFVVTSDASLQFLRTVIPVEIFAALERGRRPTKKIEVKIYPPEPLQLASQSQRGTALCTLTTLSSHYGSIVV